MPGQLTSYGDVGRLEIEHLRWEAEEKAKFQRFLSHRSGNARNKSQRSVLLIKLAPRNMILMRKTVIEALTPDSRRFP